MTPEYGATLGIFPVDEKTIDYLRATNRSDQAALVEAYTRQNGLFYTADQTPTYSDVLTLDLGSVEPCVSGPARPQDRIVLTDLKKKFADILGCAYSRDEEMARISQFHEESGTQTARMPSCKPVSDGGCRLDLHGTPIEIRHGSVVVAAITSCTNTSNPFVLLGAGLLAKKALARGLRVPPFVKTSLAPGSKVVIQYLEAAGLMPYLEGLGFHLAGFGCTTCIGNSGPLDPVIEQCVVNNDLNVASVLSGNRNFEARIHQRIKSNFLMSPMLVVAYALAGHIDVDLTYEPVGLDPNGEPVYLDDIWPTNAEIEALVKAHLKAAFYEEEYGRIFDGDEFWAELPDVKSMTYTWDDQSTYIKNPPYFENFNIELDPPTDIAGARALAVLGDTVTTDHISPAGAIPEAYPAGQYLIAQGVDAAQFNSYGSRRGNHEVMMRGTFGNIRLKNQLVGGKEGSFTMKFPQAEETTMYEAAMAYKKEGTPLVVLGGKEYGTGSSRDWAAKGSNLLGVKAVIARSFERIHRSNLVGMGVLPLVFKEGEGVEQLGLSGEETFTITGIEDIQPRKMLQVKAEKADGTVVTFDVLARLDSEVEVDYFRHGGILPFVLRKLMAS
jgi:aconitate hydratase